MDRHDDISTYDNGITVEEVVKHINHSVRLSTDTSYNGKVSERKPSNSNNGNSGNKPPERRVAPNSKVQFKSSGNKNTLSAEQKTKLEKLIIAKGGRFVGLDVVRNKEWFKMCKEKEVCRICAAKGHTAYDCPIKRRNNGNGDSKDQFSSLLDSAMQDDYQYLYTLQDISSLMLFPCIANDVFGIVLCDDAVTRNYVSLRYARQIKLYIHELSDFEKMMMKLSNGNFMRKIEIMKLEL